MVTDRYVRSGGWAKYGEHPLANRASGKRVGILGMGRIGTEVGKRATAMNNSVAYHSRKPVADVPYKHYPDLVELAKNSLDEMSLASPALAPTALFMRTQTCLYRIGR